MTIETDDTGPLPHHAPATSAPDPELSRILRLLAVLTSAAVVILLSSFATVLLTSVLHAPAA